MKVKKLEKYLNKVGSKGCKLSNLNAPGAGTLLFQSIMELGELANWGIYHSFSLNNQFVYRIMTSNNKVKSPWAKNYISLWRSKFHNSIKSSLASAQNFSILCKSEFHKTLKFWPDTGTTRNTTREDRSTLSLNLWNDKTDDEEKIKSPTKRVDPGPPRSCPDVLSIMPRWIWWKERS